MLGGARGRVLGLVASAIRVNDVEKSHPRRKFNQNKNKIVNYHTSRQVYTTKPSDGPAKELEDLLTNDIVTAKYLADEATLAHLVSRLASSSPAAVFEEFRTIAGQQEDLAAAVPTLDRLRKSLEDVDSARTLEAVQATLEADEKREDRLGFIQPSIADTAPGQNVDIYVSGELDADEIMTRENVGKYIKLSDRDFKKYLPEGTGGRLEELEFHTTKGKSMMIREPVLEAIDRLRAAEAVAFAKSKAPLPPIFDGMKGCGKSAALAQVVFWARKKGWLVIYVPSGYELINGGSYLDRSEERKEEYCSWEQPPLQYIFLNKLLDAHADKLKKIPLKTKVSLPKFTGTTLFELVEYGSVLIQYTSAVWSLLRNELALVTEFPVLLAVDEYNAVYNPSVSFRNPDSSKYLKEPMNPRQFTTAELFIDAHNGPKLAYGTFAGATTEVYARRHFDAELSENANSAFIDVKPYNREEFENAMTHYKLADWVREDVSLGTREYVYQITSGFGHEVWRYTRRL